MSPFFAYLIKSSVSLALLYILFRLAMRNDKTHSLNRFMLLGILFVSAVIPLTNFQFFYEEVQLKQVEVFREFVSTSVLTSDLAVSEIPQVQVESNVSYNPYLIIYISVILVLLIRLIVSIARVMQIIQQAEKRKLSNIVLAIVKEMIQPFTFFNKIILSEKDFNENKDIVVAHEHAHIKQMHAFDLVICELFTVVHFFNPFMWLLRRDLKLVQEYQADQAVLNKGIDAKKYQLLVLEKSVGERRFAMANHFTQKPILKRIKMMHKKKKKQWTWVKIILFIPALILLLQAFARPELITKTNEFIPVTIQEDRAAKWLEEWTVENVKHGVFQPNGLKSDENPLGKQNILRIMLNRNDDYLFGSESVAKGDVKKNLRDFIDGNSSTGELTRDFIEKELPLIGKVKVPKSIVFFNYDKASSIEARNNSLRILGGTYLKARQEKANDLFNQNYFDLNEEKRDVVDQVVPILFGYSSIAISEPRALKIFLAKSGKVQIENKEFSIDEFENHLIMANKSVKESYKKWGYETSLITSVKVEVGVSAVQINQLKEALRKAEIQYINYSSDFKEDWKSMK